MLYSTEKIVTLDFPYSIPFLVLPSNPLFLPLKSGQGHQAVRQKLMCISFCPTALLQPRRRLKRTQPR